MNVKYKEIPTKMIGFRKYIIYYNNKYDICLINRYENIVVHFSKETEKIMEKHNISYTTIIKECKDRTY